MSPYQHFTLIQDARKMLTYFTGLILCTLQLGIFQNRAQKRKARDFHFKLRKYILKNTGKSILSPAINMIYSCVLSFHDADYHGSPQRPLLCKQLFPVSITLYRCSVVKQVNLFLDMIHLWYLKLLISLLKNFQLSLSKCIYQLNY